MVTLSVQIPTRIRFKFWDRPLISPTDLCFLSTEFCLSRCLTHLTLCLLLHSRFRALPACVSSLGSASQILNGSAFCRTYSTPLTLSLSFLFLKYRPWKKSNLFMIVVAVKKCTSISLWRLSRSWGIMVVLISVKIFF